MGWLKILCVQFGCGLGREVDLLDDLEVVSIEPDDFAGGAGEETDFLQAEFDQYLCADAVVAQVHVFIGVFAGSIPRLIDVDEYALPGLGDLPEGAVN